MKNVVIYIAIAIVASLWSQTVCGEENRLPSEPVSRLGKEMTHTIVPVPDCIEKGFTLKVDAVLYKPAGSRKILEIPSVLDLCIRQHDPSDRSRQNYPAYKMPDGSVPVLEASLYLKPTTGGEPERMDIGIPLAMLDDPYGRHEILLTFSGARWDMYIDGDLLDNDFPIGWPDIKPGLSWSADPNFVSRAELYFPAMPGPSHIDTEINQVQYWTPSGHNSWVGDVVSIFHKDRYHIFYLYDRRGHQSKFGKGGHYFEHISTQNFKTWTIHEAAVPIEHQWETFGTGTPFIKDGKMHISFGYHTTRMFPFEETALPQQYEYIENTGRSGCFEVKPEAPVAAGASYSVSEDGIHFEKSGKLIHPCENPSIFIGEDNVLKMYANYGSKGTWVSDSIDGGWRCVNRDFPLGRDCTFHFRWGDYDYVIGGFINFWKKKAGEDDSHYIDVVAEGLDFYNGMSVPAISEVSDGRFLMAGWLGLKAWGGPLVIHEMVQLEHGRIGTKWMEELIPATSGHSYRLRYNSDKVYDMPSTSFLLSFDVIPSVSDGKVSLVMMPEEDMGMQDAVEWSLDCASLRAQYSSIDGSGKVSAQKSLREGGSLHRDYAIENLIGTDRPFTVRMIVRASDKFDGSVTDVEIAGKRTMLSYREKLLVKRLSVKAENCSIRNISVRVIDTAKQL